MRSLCRILAGLIVIACAGIAVAAGSGLRVIPYPAGADTETEGASSAPKSINHKHSVYFDTMTRQGLWLR